MQLLLLARCHLGIIYPNFGVIWTWVCVMQLVTGAQWINYQVAGVFETAFHNRKMNLIKFINISGLFDNFLLMSNMNSCIHSHLLK